MPSLPSFLGTFPVRDSSSVSLALLPFSCLLRLAAAVAILVPASPARSALLPSRWELFRGLGGICLSSCPPARPRPRSLPQPVQKVSILEPPSYCYPPYSSLPPSSPSLSFAWPLLSSATAAPIKASAPQPSPLQSPTPRVPNGTEFWPEPSGSAFQVLEARAG